MKSVWIIIFLNMLIDISYNIDQFYGNVQVLRKTFFSSFWTPSPIFVRISKISLTPLFLTTILNWSNIFLKSRFIVHTHIPEDGCNWSKISPKNTFLFLKIFWKNFSIFLLQTSYFFEIKKKFWAISYNWNSYVRFAKLPLFSL